MKFLPRSSFRRVLARFLQLVSLVYILRIEPMAYADGPVLHEYVPIDPSSDLEVGVVTVEGGLSPEINTRNGKISVPDVHRPIEPQTPLYSTQRSLNHEDSFVPDRDARAPDILSYDEPFRPSLAPFKRLIAFDAVESDYRLVMRHAKRTQVNLSKEINPRQPTDSFFASLALELKENEPIRIPIPIAGSVIRKMDLSPSISFHLERDSAENLFLVASRGGSARLVLQFEASRDSFASETKLFDWSDLPKKHVFVLPINVQKSADIVAKTIGVSRSEPLYQAVRSLVRYFREFKESNDPPSATNNIYLDLALSKKGVCRHRAFAFMITALGLGIPTRFVANEAHAWVEIHDGLLWRRIDLGGAGRVLDDRSEKPEKPQPMYDVPQDPYAWPAGATRGSDLLPPSGPSTNAKDVSPSTLPSSMVNSTPSSTAINNNKTNELPSSITLALPDLTPTYVEMTHNQAFKVRGHVQNHAGLPCKQVRVEVLLRQSNGIEMLAGILVTNEHGDFDGAVSVPSRAPVADYSVIAQTPGADVCAPATSE